MRMRAAIVALFVLLAAAAGATPVDLAAFLRSVEDAQRTPVALRADGDMAVTAPGTARRDQVVMIVRPPADAYIELHASGVKALLPSDGPAQRWAPGARSPESFAPAASLADSYFTREDLEPFRLSRYADARISDDSEGEITVTLVPKNSQYALEVITFDREKLVPVKTLYYRDTVNNLVKMRRDGGHVLVGRKWLPTTISMETFKLRTRSTFTLRWTQNPSFPPELFDAAFLARPSALTWPPAP